MVYQIVELTGRSNTKTYESEDAAIAAYANGSKHQVIREGLLVQVVLIDEKGRYHSKAQVRAVKPVEVAPAMTRAQLARKHDEIHNEGGYGYNPYRTNRGDR